MTDTRPGSDSVSGAGSVAARAGSGSGAAGASGEADRLLRAGALLPVGADVKAERISARIYRHAALGDRPIVRLVPDPIGEADDLALQTLDFELAEVRGPVALGRPRGLGFPASAILADPPNAGYALAVVKEMQRFARMARSKPGNAKDGFDGIAARLARTVPHFLPSFHEQAGRAFLEAGATAQAAAAFGRAREAERAYDLAVDETQRRQAFLEFALAGALTAKSLSDYAHELIRAREPAQAHEALKELCVQRTLGGLPPWTAMASELRRTARAAGLNPATEEADVLRQLLEAPATAKAAAGFWSAYRAALLRLAREDPAVRGTLLNLHPSQPEGSQDFVEWWIELLDEAGALESLTRPEEVPAASLPIGGPTAWLERTAKQANVGYYWRRGPKPMQRLLSLVEEIAPAVRATGESVQLFDGYKVDIDLLDATLAAGIEVAPPDVSGPFQPRIDLGTYASRPERRPLVALGSAASFASMLDEGLSTAVQAHASKLVELTGLHDPLRRWLRRQADRCTAGTLATLTDAVGDLQRGATPAVRALDPEATRAIAHADVAACLARTLRGGLFSELTWPALERAHVDLTVARVVGYAWPALLISDRRRVVAVGPAGQVLEHDLRIPPNTPDWGRPPMIVANGQVFVGWRGREHQGYWSGRPNDLFEPGGELGQPLGGMNLGSPTSLELADGARFAGGAPIRAGDTSAPAPRKVVSDGVTTWVLTETGTALREVDPQTGRGARASLPSFFEEFAAEGWTIDLAASWLMPRPQGADAAVVGTDRGLIGFRVRQRIVEGETEWEIEGVDGRRFKGKLGTRNAGRNPLVPVGLITLPGDDAVRPVTADTHGSGIVVWDAAGAFPVIRAAWGNPKSPGGGAAFSFMQQPVAQMSRLLEGVAFVPPPNFWFALEPRQPAASIAMRSLSDGGAKKLLAAALRDLPEKNDVGDTPPVPTVARVLAEVLPSATDEQLRAGLTGAIVMAARLARRLAALEQTPAAAPPAVASAGPSTVAGQPAAVARVIGDTALGSALAGLLNVSGRSYGFGSDTGRPLEQLATIASVIDGRVAPRGLKALLPHRSADAPITLPSATTQWYLTLGRLGAVALRAALATTPDDERETLVAFLAALAGSGYPAKSAHVRLLEVKRDSKTAPGRLTATLVWSGDRTVYIGSSQYWAAGGSHAAGFEHSPSGRFGLEKDVTLVSEDRPGRGWGDEKAVERFLDLLAKRGPVAWDPAAVDALSSRTGLSRAAASLLLAALPGIDTYEHNFLPAATRELLGIKVGDANAARDLLKGLATRERLGLLDGAMPANPADLWERGLVPVAERLADAWIKLKGRAVAIDDALLATAARQLAFAGSPPNPLRLILDPSDRRLSAEPPINIQTGWSVSRAAEDVFSPTVLRSAAVTIAWAQGAVPVGDALLEALPGALATARRTLRSPTLVVPLEIVSWPGHAEALRTLGARPWSPPRGASVQGSPLEVGPFLVVETQGDIVKTYLRPALLERASPATLLPLLSPIGLAVVESAAYVLGPDAEEMARRASASPLPAGAWEADPGASVPELVEEAAQELAVPAESARLFLQLLALPAPSKAQILTWNSWTAAGWTRAAAPLVAAGVVVTGQRARSGRDLFLAGPWVELSAPDLPIETWKLPLYGAELRSDGSVRRPLDRLVALQPFHLLFGAAWRRWAGGDRPGFEQIPGRR